jgi:hypothetical protein
MPAEYDERRAYPRVEADIAAHVSRPLARDAITIRTRNISCGGLYCRVPGYIGPSTRLHTAMILPVREAEGLRNELLEFDSIVVRVEPEKEEPGREAYHIALSFIGLTVEGRALIDRYVRQRSGDT